MSTHSLSPLSSFSGRYSQVKTSRSYRCYSHKSTGNDPVIHTHHIYCMVYTAALICLFLSQEPNKSKKIQHTNSKNSVLFEAINLIVHIEGTHFDTHQIAHYTVMWHSDTVQAVILSIACDMHHYVCILGNIWRVLKFNRLKQITSLLFITQLLLFFS